MPWLHVGTSAGRVRVTSARCQGSVRPAADSGRMTKNSISPTQWTGLLPVDDTALAVADTGGSGVPVVYLNGQFATQGYWRRVVA